MEQHAGVLLWGNMLECYYKEQQAGVLLWSNGTSLFEAAIQQPGRIDVAHVPCLCSTGAGSV